MKYFRSFTSMLRLPFQSRRDLSLKTFAITFFLASDEGPKNIAKADSEKQISGNAIGARAQSILLSGTELAKRKFGAFAHRPRLIFLLDVRLRHARALRSTVANAAITRRA